MPLNYSVSRYITFSLLHYRRCFLILPFLNVVISGFKCINTLIVYAVQTSLIFLFLHLMIGRSLEVIFCTNARLRVCLLHFSFGFFSGIVFYIQLSFSIFIELYLLMISFDGFSIFESKYRNYYSRLLYFF